eukprot:3554234-Prymnesium_polylepis.1
MSLGKPDAAPVSPDVPPSRSSKHSGSALACEPARAHVGIQPRVGIQLGMCVGRRARACTRAGHAQQSRRCTALQCGAR